MKHHLAAVLALLALGCTGGTGAAEEKSGRALPSCDWCGAMEAPPDLRSEARIAGPDEPGERLVITGTVYKADGRTPVPGVVIYAYHTNSAGIYPQKGGETGNARRHGYLRGWVKTDDQGRYRFTTIRPGSYPTGDNPAHVHMTVLPPGGEEYWIEEITFEDDPLVPPPGQRPDTGRGGLGLIKLTREADGGWTGVRNIVLEP